jgi:isopentenyl-diphosphate delta-isomerase
MEIPVMFGEVILVDATDTPLGRCEKLAAHRTGVLHRAFSVFLFDSEGRWLLQRRHPDKYHSGGLWTNTCCSHPQPGQETGEAARIRLLQEMGVETPIRPLFQFFYQAHFDNGLIEHELDHVFVGSFDGTPCPNPAEVCDWRWVESALLMKEMATHPEHFTVWFREAASRVLGHMESKAV